MAIFSDLDRLLQSFVADGLPGCSLKVAQHGKVLYEGYFGVSDLESGAALTRRSLFRQASLSKISLYTAMMILYERGKFLLTDPISDFFPEWKETTHFERSENGHLLVVPNARPVTVRDTLSMKCGLPYCNGPQSSQDPTFLAMCEKMKPLWQQGRYTLREQIAAMADVPQAFEPGTGWRYGFSSELAAGILETVCGKPVGEALRELLFDPLGMDSTGDIFFGDTQERLVPLYRLNEQGSVEPTSFPMDAQFLPGPQHDAGWRRLFSCVDDYTKLLQMLACGGVSMEGRRLMSAGTIDLMRSPGLNAVQQAAFEDGYNAGYSYGYGVRTLVDKARGNHNGSIGAFGWTGAFGTWCEADPSEGLSIVYMHNFLPNQEGKIHPRVRNVVYGCIE